MQNANFEVELLGWPQEGQMGVFIVGTCDVADDGDTWHIIFEATAPPVTPWPNPQEVHGPDGKIRTELHLFKKGGTVSYSWNTLQVNVWRNASGRPTRVYCEGDGGLGIEFDTGAFGYPPEHDFHTLSGPHLTGTLAFLAQPGVIED